HYLLGSFPLLFSCFSSSTRRAFSSSMAPCNFACRSSTSATVCGRMLSAVAFSCSSTAASCCFSCAFNSSRLVAISTGPGPGPGVTNEPPGHVTKVGLWQTVGTTLQMRTLQAATALHACTLQMTALHGWRLHILALHAWTLHTLALHG